MQSLTLCTRKVWHTNLEFQLMVNVTGYSFMSYGVKSDADAGRADPGSIADVVNDALQLKAFPNPTEPLPHL